MQVTFRHVRNLISRDTKKMRTSVTLYQTKSSCIPIKSNANDKLDVFKLKILNCLSQVENQLFSPFPTMFSGIP